MYIKIIRFKDRPDGSALVDVEYNKDFTDMIKKVYKRKRCTKNLIEKAVNAGLENYIKLQEKKGK